jgi:endoglucanase
MVARARHSASVRVLSHIFLVALTFFVGISPAHAASAYIRVNQVGYPGSSTKRAYLMASGAETGATFAVKNSSGTTVYSASVGVSLGAWGSFTSVYALDFDSVSTAGTYTISVASPIAATSPAFKIDTAANLYATPLANSLYYYETSRDGPNYIPNALRTAPGHLNDQSAKAYFTPTFNRKDNAGPLTATGAVIDASGGWWDAGDYMKFVETHSYTVAMMLIGVRDFSGQLGSGSSTSNFTA